MEIYPLVEIHWATFCMIPGLFGIPSYRFVGVIVMTVFHRKYTSLNLVTKWVIKFINQMSIY